MPTVDVFFGIRFWGSLVAALACVCALNRQFHKNALIRYTGFLTIQGLLFIFGLRVPPLTLLWIVLGGLLIYRLSTTQGRLLPSILVILMTLALLFRSLLFTNRAPMSVSYLIVGFSYLSLRVISFIVDYQNQRIPSPSPIVFLCYILFIPAFVAGPIHRYAPFAQALSENTKLSSLTVRKGIERILTGLIKKFILSSLLARWSISFLDPSSLEQMTTMQMWLSLYAYAWMLYLDFSGYSDLAIGSGALFGIPLPENFDWPYFRRNLISFWNSWHASLSAWLREFIFLPVGQQLFRWQPFQMGPLAIGTCTYLLTMLVCGLWHGIATHYWIWGLYHGLGLSFYKVLKYLFDRHAPLRLQTFWYQTRPAYVLATGVNFHFVVLGWVWFVFDQPTAMLVFKRLSGGML